MSTLQREGIVVLGSPRSGTTLMRQLLDAHPRIACPGETNLFSACARFLHSERIEGGVDVSVLAGLHYAGFSAAEVLSRLREFAFAFHREHARRAGKARWAEKTAFDTFHLATLDRLIGDHVQYVCMLRHGLDVVCSLQDLCDKNGIYLSELYEYIKQTPRPLEAFAKAWVDLTQAILALVKCRPESSIVVRYEDLVAHPASVMSRIFGFLGEDWEPTLLERAMQTRHSAGLGDWKTYQKRTIEAGSVNRWQRLPHTTVSSLAAFLNPTMRAAGYDPLPAEAELSDDQARRRYELGLFVNALQKP